MEKKVICLLLFFMSYNVSFHFYVSRLYALGLMDNVSLNPEATVVPN